jgi:RHS repeat-associated protein
MRPNGSGWSTHFVHEDGLGSVRAITDETGAVVDTRGYEAFGTKNSEAGSETLAYGFAGEALDSTTNLAYHRARWMDSRVGRFTGMDPSEGQPPKPSSLHRYSYTLNNPANWTDPTGWDAGDGGIGGAGAGDILADASFSLQGAVFSGGGAPCNVDPPFTGNVVGLLHPWGLNGPGSLNLKFQLNLRLLPSSTRAGCVIDQAVTYSSADARGPRRQDPALRPDYVGLDSRWWNGTNWNPDIYTQGAWENMDGEDEATWSDFPGGAQITFPYSLHIHAITRVSDLLSGIHRAGVSWEIDLTANSQTDVNYTDYENPATPSELNSW